MVWVGVATLRLLPSACQGVRVRVCVHMCVCSSGCVGWRAFVARSTVSILIVLNRRRMTALHLKKERERMRERERMKQWKERESIEIWASRQCYDIYYNSYVPETVNKCTKYTDIVSISSSYLCLTSLSATSEFMSVLQVFSSALPTSSQGFMHRLRY